MRVPGRCRVPPSSCGTGRVDQSGVPTLFCMFNAPGAGATLAVGKTCQEMISAPLLLYLTEFHATRRPASAPAHRPDGIPQQCRSHTRRGRSAWETDRSAETSHAANPIERL